MSANDVTPNNVTRYALNRILIHLGGHDDGPGRAAARVLVRRLLRSIGNEAESLWQAAKGAQ